MSHNRLRYHQHMSALDKQLTHLLSTYPQFELAILFASAASGNLSAESDIDVAILSDKPISGKLKLELIEKIGACLVRMHALPGYRPSI